MSKVRIGGADTYTLRSNTLVENYMPGPMRQNLLMDPDRAFGKVVTKTYGDDYIYNGPGTIAQAIPNIPNHNYQYAQIFSTPTGNPYRNFGIDDRQIAAYQVVQLHNNPLSQYSTNPSGPVPSFECMAEPDNFSTMVNKFEKDYYKYFEEDYPPNWLIGTTGGQNIYHQYSGKPVNSNAALVYNLSLDSESKVNPMIALGSSSVSTSAPSFTGKCYSGNFVPGQSIGDLGGDNPPKVYGGQSYRPRTLGDEGILNKSAKDVCIPDKSVRFVNSLILE